MLSPKSRKFKYAHLNHFKGKKQIKLNPHGNWGLFAETRGIITAAQIESARQAISKRIKKIGKVWICIFPHRPFTQKAAETRMGSGKGSVSYRYLEKNHEKHRPFLLLNFQHLLLQFLGLLTDSTQGMGRVI